MKHIKNEYREISTIGDKVEGNIKFRTNIIAIKPPFKTSLVTSIKESYAKK